VVYSPPMETPRTNRWLSLLATLAAAAVFAVGCGDDDNDGGNGGGGGLGETTQEQTDAPATDSPVNNEAIDRCFEAADKLSGEAKEQAEAACRAAETGDTDEIKEKAKEQCLEAAKQLPDESARKQAEEECEKFGE
jgi:hypothetical protein